MAEADSAAAVVDAPVRVEARSSEPRTDWRRQRHQRSARPQTAQLNSRPSTPGLREQVFCTKIGTTRPDEMYIVGGHMDGIGYGEAANNDGSGTALVMELARIFSSPNVQTERSIRFALWNNEETAQRRPRRTLSSGKICKARKTRPDRGGFPNRSGSG